MTLEKAFESLIESGAMQKKAQGENPDKKYNVYINRFRKGQLGTGAMVDLLTQFGYTVDVKPPK